jgi:drug/metabolite transporter (DMT)-like permease
MINKSKLAVFAAAGTGIQVGAALVASRYAVEHIGPAGLAMYRYIIGVFCLAPVIWMIGWTRFDRRDVVPIALLGIGQFGILVALLNLGLKYVPAGRAALIFATFPFMTLIIGRVLGREELSGNKVVGVLATILGVAVVLGPAVYNKSFGTSEWLGVLAILGSAFSGALCSVLYGPYVRKYPALQVSFFAMLAAAVFLILVAIPEGVLAQTPALKVNAWSAILFIGLSSAIGYYLWLWALANSTATKVTVFLSLSPITAAVLALIFLNEPLNASLLVAVALVSFGLWLVNR